MKIARWSPQRDLFGLQSEMNRLFENFFDPDFFRGGEQFDSWLPKMDVSENDQAFRVDLELPGLSKEDINLSLQDNILTIEGERKQEAENKEINYHRVERTYGKFLRRFSLPTLVQADKIDAEFKDGILHITLPKAEEVKPRKISIKADK